MSNGLTGRLDTGDWDCSCISRGLLDPPSLNSTYLVYFHWYFHIYPHGGCQIHHQCFSPYLNACVALHWWLHGVARAPIVIAVMSKSICVSINISTGDSRCCFITIHHILNSCVSLDHLHWVASPLIFTPSYPSPSRARSIQSISPNPCSTLQAFHNDLNTKWIYHHNTRTVINIPPPPPRRAVRVAEFGLAVSVWASAAWLDSQRVVGALLGLIRVGDEHSLSALDGIQQGEEH